MHVSYIYLTRSMSRVCHVYVAHVVSLGEHKCTKLPHGVMRCVELGILDGYMPRNILSKWLGDLFTFIHVFVGVVHVIIFRCVVFSSRYAGL